MEGSVNNDVIYCNRCGAPMKKNQRYCMKCGNLNYDHPDNRSMRAYATGTVTEGGQQQPYVVGENNLNLAIGNEAVRGEVLADKAGKRKTCFLVNVLLFLISVVILTVVMFSFTKDFAALFADPVYNVVLLMLTFIFFYFLAMQFLYMKANRPWWSFFVPIYGQWIQYEISMGSGIYFLLSFIPIVGTIISLVSTYQLGKKFGKSGWLTLFFGFIMIPAIAFGSNVAYEGIIYIPKDVSQAQVNGEKTSENTYKLNRQILLLFGIFALWGIAGLVLGNLDSIVGGFSSMQTNSYLEQTEAILESAITDISESSYTCDTGESIHTSGRIFYVYFVEGDYFKNDKIKKSSFNGEALNGFVIIDNTNIRPVYSISITDGENGFIELSEYDLESMDSVDKVSSVSPPQDAILCVSN